MDRFTRGIAMTSARHPWRTIAGWVLVMATVFFLAATGGGTFTEQFGVPDSQSARALDLLDEGFPEAAKGKVLVVFAAEDGETLESHRADVAAVLTEVATLDHVASVSDPFAAGTVSEDGRIGYAELTLDAPQREIGKPAFTVLSNAVSGIEVPGLQVELGGDAVFLNAEDDTGHAGIGLLVALLVLVVVFGTIVAALVPIGLSIVAVGAGIGAITLLAGTMDVSVSAIPIAGLVGLGVGDRLRAVRRGALPGEPCRRPGQHPALGKRDGLVGRCRGLRGRDRRHRDGVPRPHRPRGPHLHRARHRAHGALRGRRRRHPAPGAPQPAGRPDRQRPGDPSAPHRRRPEDTAWWRFGHRVSGRPWPYLLGAVVALLAIAAPDARGCRPPSPRRVTPPPRPRTGRPTTCSPTGSAPGSTARCWWWSTWTPPAWTRPTCRA